MYAGSKSDKKIITNDIMYHISNVMFHLFLRQLAVIRGKTGEYVMIG